MTAGRRLCSSSARVTEQADSVRRGCSACRSPNVCSRPPGDQVSVTTPRTVRRSAPRPQADLSAWRCDCWCHECAVRTSGVFDCLQETLSQLHGGLPAEDLLGQCDVRPASDWVVGRKRQPLNGGTCSSQLDNEIRQLRDRELARVAEVDRTRGVCGVPIIRSRPSTRSLT